MIKRRDYTFKNLDNAESNPWRKKKVEKVKIRKINDKRWKTEEERQKEQDRWSTCT